MLRGAHDHARLAAGEQAWETPDIIPWSSWLQRAWNDLLATGDGPHPALLGPRQDLSLWEQVIRHRPPPDGLQPLLQTGAAARNAQAAWSLLRAWRLELDGDLGFPTEEVRAFQAWARDYGARCQADDWLDPAGVADRLAEGLTREALGDTRRVLLAGLDSLTPQQQALVTRLEALGVNVERWAPATRAGRCVRYPFATADDELLAAARWARRRLEEGAAGPIGIVVPGLAADRLRVETAFAEVFSPGSARPASVAADAPFNISLGRPLAEVPVVADALLALRAMSGRLTLADASGWCLSPYLGGAPAGWRARFDRELRRIGEPRFEVARIAELAAVADAGGDAGREEFLRTLEALRGTGETADGRRGITAWVGAFSAWLIRAGWPGARTLSSDEFQAVQSFRDLLAGLAGLAPVLPDTRFPEALAELESMAGEQTFQPRTESATVQILGVLEASCIDFSHLWISGLHHDAWPERPKPNPFLPVALQRERGMPRADSEQQLRWARDWTERMLASADEVIVSHPSQRDDEPLRPSALVAHIPAADPSALFTDAPPTDPETVRKAAPVLETMEDSVAPAVRESGTIRGGVSVFKDQAACPFRAFARHRLDAEDVATPESSLDPKVRGTLAHRVLEYVWSSLGGQSALLAMTPSERAELVAASVRRALAEEARRRPGTLRGRLLAMEQGRFEALAEAWLEIEARRAPFDVEAEHAADADVGGLPVRLRPDRVDRLDDGRLFLVDYKTGECAPADWFGERPDEPQLPLYALALDDAGDGAVVGLAFGVLRPRELGYEGLGEGDDLPEGVKALADSRIRSVAEADGWQAHKDLWRERLERIAREFLAGDARVDPRQRSVTCRHCGLQPLCRVNES